MRGVREAQDPGGNGLIGGDDLGDLREAGRLVARHLLETHRDLKLVDPKVNVRISAGHPPAWYEALAASVASGGNTLSIFNDEVVIPANANAGKALEDCRLALRNTRRMLRPGGFFRLVLPDLEHFVKAYMASKAPNAALEFMEETYLGKKKRPRGLTGFLPEYLGNSGHLWMWDFNSLAMELEFAGFDGIRRAYFGDSEEKMFA